LLPRKLGKLPVNKQLRPKASAPECADAPERMDSERLCPSARCEDGALLLGIVAADGVIGYLTPPLMIDHVFVQRAQRGRSPERRFRFAQPCITQGCAQWTGDRCGLIDRALQVAAQQRIMADAQPATRSAQSTSDMLNTPRDSYIPRCGIRARCRWFAQDGLDACGVCPLVITEGGPSTQ
jgi:hypothetical protein